MSAFLPQPDRVLTGPAAAADSLATRIRLPTRPTSTGLSILTLNVGAAALPRADAILDWLLRRQPDLIVLTETSAGAGTRRLIDGLGEDGFETYGDPTAGGRDRGVVVASRVRVRRALATELAVTLPWRAVGVVLDTSPQLTVLGVYVPSRDRTPAKVERKRAFISSLMASVASLPGRFRDRMLLIGDYNVVSRQHEPRLPGFFPYEYAMHDDLVRCGFASAHELCGLASQPHSWIGRTGIGYLYDYVHVGCRLHKDVRDVSYVDEPRRLRLSDHAAVTAHVKLAGPANSKSTRREGAPRPSRRA